jgi:2-polyprenyl-6-methoxyphenol hydroxylase-like FAD-dependent oxidoreductase
MCAVPPELARVLGRPRLRKPRPSPRRSTRSRAVRQHAVVIGASMAGLLAARVLSETYERVTLLDRDTWPDRPEPRGGVPHGRHAHGLLARGSEILDELFPGLTADLVAAGAVAGDLQHDVRWYFADGPLAQAPSRLRGVAVSRPFLEYEVRRRVDARPGITIEPGRVVRDLTYDAPTRRVTGVLVAAVGTDEPTTTLAADLVVDASGRNSRTPQWLRELDYPTPREEKVRVDVSYTTRHFRRDPGSAGDALAVVVAASPDSARGGALIGQEGDRWILTLGGYHGDRAPVELTAFRARAAELAPEFGEVARTAEPLDAGRYFRFPASVRRRYEKLRRFPERFVVLGDAVCSFNPVYGQGMSVAAEEALRLRDCLAAGVDRLGPRFFGAITSTVDVPWQVAAGADLDLPGTPGRPSLPARLVNRYVRRLHRAARGDDDLAAAFLRVANLKAPPPSLMRPDRLARVLLHGGRRRPAPSTYQATDPQPHLTNEGTPPWRPHTPSRGSYPPARIGTSSPRTTTWRPGSRAG